MKKILSIITTVLLLLVIAVSCAQDVTVDTQLYGAQGSGTFMLNGKYYNTLQEAVNARLGKGAKAAGANDDVIYLTRNAKGPGAKIDDPNISVIIDFAGWTYSFTDVTATQGSTSGTFGLSITDGANVTLKGLEQIDLHDTTANLTMVYVEGADTKLTIEDAPKMKVEPTQYVFWAANGATLTIGGETTLTGGLAATGTVEKTPLVSINDGAKADVSSMKLESAKVIPNSTENLKVSTLESSGESKIINSGSGDVTVTKSEGTVVVQNTGEGTVKVDENTIPEGQAKVIEDGEVQPTIVTVSVAMIGTKEYETFENAYSDSISGDTIILLANIDFTSYARGTEHEFALSGRTLDLNSKTISSRNMGVVYTGSDLIIKNGSFVAVPNTDAFADETINDSYALFIGRKGQASATLENLVLIGGLNVSLGSSVTIQGENTSITGTKYYAVWVQGSGKVTIKDGQYSLATKGIISTNTSSYINNTGYVLAVGKGETVLGDTECGTIEISGGKFVVPASIPGRGENKRDPDLANIGTGGQAKTNITIKGGTYNVNPSTNVADGYIAKYDSAKQLWTVVEDTPEVKITKDGEQDKTMTLASFRNKVNAGNTYAGYTVTLLDDVDLKGVEWTPIGTAEHPFSGVFDGAGCTISNYKLGGTGKDNAVALFGYIKGTEAETLKQDTDISSFYDSDYNVTLPGENIFGCTVKNLNVSNVTAETTCDGWTSAAVSTIYNATVSNVHVLKSTITGNEKVGGVIAYVPNECGAMILNCSTDTKTTVTTQTGNHAAGILGRIAGTTSRVIIANCTNNATINCHGVCGAGIIGMGKGSLIYNCVNNGDVSGNSRVAGIIAETGAAGNAIISSTNNGDVNGGSTECTIADSSAAGIVAYCNGHTTVVACVNNGSVSGNCSIAAVVSGIAGSTGDSSNIIILNCLNTGELTNNAEGGKTYEISHLHDTIQVGTPENVSQLNTWLSENDIVEIISLSNLLSTDVIAPTKANTLRLDGQNNQIKLDISGLNNKDCCIEVYAMNSSIEISGNGSNSDLKVYGNGNTVSIPQGCSIKSLFLTGDNFIINNSGTIAEAISFGDGSTGTINNESNASINGGIGSIAHTPCNITINNRGIITKNSVNSGSRHTIDFDYSSHHVVINNYGTIENVGDSYVLLFYIGASLDYNAYNGSLLKKQGKSNFIIVNSTSTIAIHYQSGSNYKLNDVQHEWTDYQPSEGITVNPMQ